MSVQNYGTQAQRIGRFKGQILAHAQPEEILAKYGDQVKFPKNNSDTYVFRRFIPYGAASTNANTLNQFFSNATGDRGNVIVQGHQTQEGVTPLPDSITAVDVTVVMQQYSCLYGFTDKVYDLYEDDISKQMSMQVGERITLVNELIIQGVLKGCTNAYYGGAGTTIATVAGGLTINLIRKIVRNLQANHAKPVNKMLSASANYGTSAISAGYLVFCHTDLEADIRDLPNFVPVEKYSSVKPMPHEIGAIERFRFIGHPDMPSYQDGGAAIGATGLLSTNGTSLDVYPVIVVGEDAWAQVAIRGKESLKPVLLLPGESSKADVFGQRGYAGSIWWKAAAIKNNGWMAIAFVGAKNLT